MGASLASLVNNLPNEPFTETYKSYIVEHLELMTCKGVFPDDSVDSWQRLDETFLPTKELLNNRLTFSDIGKDDYLHAQKIWTTFDCPTSSRGMQC